MKKLSNILCAALLAVSVIYFIGTVSFLSPCAGHEDGYMTCHWAGQALTGLGCAMAIMCALSLALRGKMRAGALLSTVPMGTLIAYLPGHLIDLCMMPSMTCRAVTQPAAVACGIIMAVLGGVGALVSSREARMAA